MSIDTAKVMTTFSQELHEAFLAANILLRKLDNPKLRNFLEKWTQHVSEACIYNTKKLFTIML